MTAFQVSAHPLGRESLIFQLGESLIPIVYRENVLPLPMYQAIKIAIFISIDPYIPSLG